VNKILVGNNSHCEDQRVVSFKEGEELAKEFNIRFFEVSAEKDQNVETAFLTLTKEVNDRVESV
jgi:hypothetical protein